MRHISFRLITFLGLLISIILPFQIAAANPVSIATNDSSDTCKLYGDTIHAHKIKESTLGNYGDREDVRAFALQVAKCYGLDYKWVLNTLTQAQYQASTAKFIMPQPPTTRNWSRFITNFVRPERIKAGVIFWQNNEKWLEQAEKDFGVPPKIVLGILGVETIYGQFTGNFRIIDALSTLSFDFPTGRSDRTDYFSGELAAFLEFSAREGVDPLSIRGSYAGAMGMPQFMPSSIQNYALDYDGDGHIDLNNSSADIIGSVANYLALHHWQTGIPGSFAVQTNKATQEQIDFLKQADIVPSFTVMEMAHHGVSIRNHSLAKQLSPDSVKLSFITLENGTDAAPTYVAGTQNFFVITRYNRSSFYAMSVIELGNAVEHAYLRTKR